MAFGGTFVLSVNCSSNKKGQVNAELGLKNGFSKN